MVRRLIEMALRLCREPNKNVPPSAPSDRSNLVHLRSSAVRKSLDMSASNISRSPNQGFCYFSIPPRQSSYYDETPMTTPFTPPNEEILSDPSNPLLAYRPALQSPPSEIRKATMDASSLLQLQTQAAHVPALRRPQPQPLQNVLAVSDEATTPNDDSYSSAVHTLQSPIELARCSRCHRSQSIDMATGKAANMVSYGLNSFYCTRCASIVGFQSR